MHLKHVIAQDNEKKTVTMLLYGAIGNKIDGDYFAREIDYLSREYDEITIRINSEGGNVLQGLSIFNAMLNSKAYIIASIDGVAASMAGVIPMAADEIHMNDFARIMVHNPYFSGRANLTNKEKKTIENLGGILNSILSRRGVENGKMAEFMAKETWFTAQEALDLKLIDKIVDTGKKLKVENELQSVAAQSFTPELFNNYLQIQPQKMKVLAALFGMAETATETEIVNEIKALQLENTALKAQKTQFEKLSNELKAQIAADRKKEVEAMVDGAIAAGHFSAEQRDSIVTMGINSFDAFKPMIESLKKPAAQSLTAALGGASASAAAVEEKHDFEWYRRNDPAALANMKLAEPERFKKLYADWEKENM